MLDNSLRTEDLLAQPSNIQAEGIIFGCIILETGRQDYYLAQLKPDYFYNPMIKLAIQGMNELREKNVTIDLVSISDYCDNKQWLEDIKYDKEKSEDYKTKHLMIFMDYVESVSSPVEFDNALKLVKDKYLKRKIIEFNHQLNYLVTNEAIDNDKTIEMIENFVLDARRDSISNSYVHISEGLDTKLERVMKNRQLVKEGKEPEARPVLSTKLKKLDWALNGGLVRGDFIVLAGRPSMGKSSFAMEIIKGLSITQDKHVLFINLEMAKDQLENKFISNLSGINYDVIDAGTYDESLEGNVLESFADISKSNLHIMDKSEITLSELKGICRNFVIEHKAENVGAIVLDYIQLMVGDNEEDYKAITKISRALKIIAKDLNIPVIGLSQLSRMVEQRQNKRPMMSDLRGSGAIEQDADIIMMLYRDEYYNPDTADQDICEVNLAKFRMGKKQILKFMTDLECSRFKSLDY